MAKGWTDKRPMSPHMSIWKWHPAMLSSILHRVSVVIVFLVLVKLCIWLVLFGLFPSVGERGFAALKGLVYSPLGVFVFFLLSAALVYHGLIDLRHLLWDAGKGLAPQSANKWSIVLIVGAGVIAALLSFLLVRGFS